ncbi:E3 ubiquitin-protein ligase TRIM39-like [Pleurodeles waltl]|uniref:E3 ubiquitin-protein ligase TRIM39-like n=1 Tax=Pleurodeles waltl TaxID=8319 RepID=UPI0037098403
MAAAAQLGNLKEEATCSICLEYFKDPVSLECGHNFCRSCITQSWEGRDRNSPCPQCRGISPGRNLRPNRQLGNMVDMLKELHLPPVKPPEENLCEKHEEKLSLFCAEDQRMICWVCRESKEHKTHPVSPIEEAAEEYKVKLHEWLRPLKKEKEYISDSKVKQEEQYNHMWNTLRSEKQNIESEFEKLRRLLKENEQIQHRRLEEMEKKLTMIESSNVAKLSSEITSLSALIMEIEKMCEAPAWELLKDAGSTLSRCNNVRIQCPEIVLKSYKASSGLLRGVVGKENVHSWDPASFTPEGKTEQSCQILVGPTRQRLGFSDDESLALFWERLVNPLGQALRGQ